MQKFLKCLTFLLWFTGVSGLLSCSVAFARQRGELVPGSRYVPARAAALGDAFLPLPDDGASALFYNPAAIARLRHTSFEPVNILVDPNDKFLSMTNLNSWKLLNLGYAVDILGARPGAVPSIGGTYLPTFYFRGFAMGAMLQSRVTAKVFKEADGTEKVRYRSRYMFVPSIGTGVRLASGVVRLGYSFQWVQQAYGDITLPKATKNLGYNVGLAEGTAFSHNFGFALTLPIRYLPAFNMVLRNVLQAKYNGRTVYSLAKNPNGTPKDEPMTVDVSASIQPKVGRGAYFNLVFVYRDMTNQSGVSLLGRSALGIEFSFRDLFYLRSGYGSAYLNYGIGFKRKKAEVSLSYYAEEYGESYYTTKDRRILLQYQVRAF